MSLLSRHEYSFVDTIASDESGPKLCPAFEEGITSVNLKKEP